jgi:hypothetical protein
MDGWDGGGGYGQVINPTQYRTSDIIRHDASNFGPLLLSDHHTETGAVAIIT